MNKHSNRIILLGIIILIVASLHKLSPSVNLSFNGVGEWKSEYWLWIVPIIAVVFIGLIIKSKKINVLKFFLGPIKLILFIAVIFGAIRFFPSQKWAELMGQPDSEENELVTIRPGEYTVVNLKYNNKWSFAPPEPTMVEQLDCNHKLIPILLNGQQVDRYIDYPEDNNSIESFPEAVRFLGLRSVNPSVGEYSFVVYKR